MSDRLRGILRKEFYEFYETNNIGPSHTPRKRKRSVICAYDATSYAVTTCYRRSCYATFTRYAIATHLVMMICNELT